MNTIFRVQSTGKDTIFRVQSTGKDTIFRVQSTGKNAYFRIIQAVCGAGLHVEGLMRCGNENTVVYA